MPIVWWCPCGFAGYSEDLSDPCNCPECGKRAKIWIGLKAAVVDYCLGS